MKKNYDFEHAEQGKFYRPIEQLEIPVYVDKDVQRLLMKQAAKEDKSISEIVNALLKTDIAIAQALN
jgi:hypothetical protein